MAIREALNGKKGVAAVGAGALICIAILFIVIESRGVNTGPLSKVFYTTDDGKTWFTGDSGKLFPFDHDGQPAYRVDVYKTSDGKEFVGYIERYTDSAKAQLAQLMAQPQPDQMKIASVTNDGLEIKRPGASKWYRLNSPEGTEIMATPSPDGSAVVGVMP